MKVIIYSYFDLFHFVNVDYFAYLIVIFHLLIANNTPFPSLQIFFTLQAISSHIILDYQPDFINLQALIYLLFIR